MLTKEEWITRYIVYPNPNTSSPDLLECFECKVEKAYQRYINTQYETHINSPEVDEVMNEWCIENLNHNVSKHFKKKKKKQFPIEPSKYVSSWLNQYDF